MPSIHHLLLAASILIATHADAQECGQGRYTDPTFFAEVDTAIAVPFGSNTGLDGNPQTLSMDVYMPANDALPERPVVLVAFGGSFVTGSREDVGSFCDLLAHHGYVAVAMDYRVGLFFPNELTTLQAVQRCVHDLKACVRYLRRTVAEDGNPYAIDTDRIILGGVSAGAIGALHATYMDLPEELPAALLPDSAAVGGLEGNSGSPGYSSDVMGCFALSGAILDTLMIVPGDQPVCMIHETGDPMVPCFTQEVLALGIPTGIVVSGSGDIHRRAVHTGVPDCYLEYVANDHGGYLEYDPVNAVGHVLGFLARLACAEEPIGCAGVVQVVAEQEARAPLRVYPSPASDAVSIDLSEPAAVVITDLSGREVWRRALGQGPVTLDVRAWPEGMYVVRTLGARPSTARWMKGR